MLAIISAIGSVALTAYLVSEVWRAGKEYRVLKEYVAEGDSQARWKFYLRILRFEWVSALLAAIALGFDRAKLNAATLEINGTKIGRWLDSMGRGADSSAYIGIGIGLGVGLALMIAVRLRARRGATVNAPSRVKPWWWRKLIPDFAALVPVTRRERLLFVAVALSAGICEEAVFRGWLLFTLHRSLGLAGTGLVVTAAAVFGAAHLYQGATGILAAAIAGAMFCALYIGTGTLLIPIVLHSVIDLRMALLPAPARN